MQNSSTANTTSKVITFGEIMLRLSAPAGTRLLQTADLYASWAGSEANVAVALARMGVSAGYVSALPIGLVGDRCIDELLSHGVDCSCINRAAGRMGLFFLEPGSMSRPPRVIYDRADSVISRVSRDAFDWDAILENARWLHLSGITPALSKNARIVNEEAARVARQKSVPVSVDLNYRSTLWQNPGEAQSVMSEVLKYADYVIGNEEDFAVMITGEDLEIGSSVEEQVQEFSHTAGLVFQRLPHLKRLYSSIRISHSAEHNDWCGASVGPDGDLVTARPWSLKAIVDRVGAGDAFAAGVISGLIGDKPFKDGLNFSVAAGALKHTIAGDFLRATADEVSHAARADSKGSRIRR